VSYVEGKSAAGSPVGSAAFRGHEFHYSDVVLDKKTKYAYRLSRGIGIRNNLDGAVTDRTLGSYTHLHPLGSLGMMRNFVKVCRKKACSHEKRHLIRSSTL
jgi:cobyrinic acid a,c-diamide synthase